MDQAVSPATSAGRNLSLGGAALGTIGLIGWLTGLDALVTIVPGQPPMMPNTALALLLLGLVGALHQAPSDRMARSLSALAAAVVLALGLWTTAQYLLEPSFSIDALVVRGKAGPYPGRPSPPTAIALSLLAAAILASEWRSIERSRLSEWLILCAGVIALTFAVAQLFGAGPLYRFWDTPVVGVAVPTALGLLLIAAGLLLKQPDSVLMHVATSPTAGDMMLRRLAPALILIALVLGFAGSRLAEIVGSENIPVLRAALTVFGIALVLPLFVVTARKLNRAHSALERAQTRTRELIELASEGIFVANLDGRYTEVNEAACRMLGYSREEILAKTIIDLIPPEERERLWRDKERFLEGDSDVDEWKLLKKDGTYLPVEVSAKILPDGRWQAFVRDITQRKRTQEALRQTRERFELALKGANLGSWDWNITTGEVISTARCAEMRGFRPEEITPHADSYFASIHPDDLPAFQKALSDCFEGTRPDFECEYRARSKSGDWVWILSQGNIFARDEQGRPARMVGTALDVTPRKRAQEAVRLSEAKFSGIVSISADAIISIDEEHKITLFNEGAEKVFGRSKADAIGAPLDILVPERLRASHARGVKEFEAGPETTRRLGGGRTEILGVRSNGEEFPADASVSKIMIGGKRILTAALRDISEQKRLDTEHRLLAELGGVHAGLEFEERLTSIAQLVAREVADLCIVDVVEDDGSIRRARVSCRDATKEWLCDLLMRPLGSERPRFLGPALEHGKAAVIQKVTPDIINSWAQDQDDRTALQSAGFQSAIVAPLLARGKALGLVSLLSLSRPFGEMDLRLIEAIAPRAALLLDNARLFAAAKRATQARNDILGIVAHDLRNPLTVVATLAAFLRRQGPDEEAIEEIEYAVARMNRLIQDLVDVTRMEAGRLAIDQAWVSSTEILSDSIVSQASLASSVSLELHLDAPPDLPHVWADRNRLLQVLENLMGNAIKFTKPGGHITLAAAAGVGEVLFSVTDTGCGIESDHLPHVFDRFWQAPESRRRGAGLGLPIVKGIVEAHGGRVWVQSSPGQGTTVFFTIPVQSQSPRRREAAALYVTPDVDSAPAALA